MEAITAALEAAGPPGGVVLAVCGATDALLSAWRDCGRIRLTRARVGELGQFAQLVAEQRPALVFGESASNPLLRVAAVPRLAALVHGVGGRWVVDTHSCRCG